MELEHRGVGMEHQGAWIQPEAVSAAEVGAQFLILELVGQALSLQAFSCTFHLLCWQLDDRQLRLD